MSPSRLAEPRARGVRDGAAGHDAIEEGRDLLEAALPRRDGHRRPRSRRRRRRGPGRASTSSTPSSPGRGRWWRGCGCRRTPAATSRGVLLRTRAARAGARRGPGRGRARARPRRSRTPATRTRAWCASRPTAKARSRCVFHVEAGPRTRVASVEVVAPEPGRRARCRSCGCGPGSRTALRDVAADRAALVTSPTATTGYLSAEVDPRGATSPKTPPRRASASS